MKTEKEITALAEKRYGTNPHSFGGQRDGFKEGYKQAQEIQYSEKRYFIVNYIGILGIRNCTGMINMVSDALFLNKKRAFEIIEEHNTGITQIVITNILELSQKDYESWTD